MTDKQIIEAALRNRHKQLAEGRPLLQIQAAWLREAGQAMERQHQEALQAFAVRVRPRWKRALCAPRLAWRCWRLGLPIGVAIRSAWLSVTFKER